MAKTSVKKYDTDESPRSYRAVQNYIYGQPSITKKKALLDAGYPKTTAEKKPQIITDHPLYHEWKLAQAQEVKVSKDYINLRMLKRLAGELTFDEEVKALDFLATINGYKPKEGVNASPINIWNMLAGGNGDLGSEKDFKERSDHFFKGGVRTKTRL